MGALSPILRSVVGGQVAFHCPGCGHAHSIPVRIDSAPAPQPDPDDPDWTPPRHYYEARDGAWSWNGSASKPTFMPSILVRYPHMSPEQNERCKQFRLEHGRDATHAEIPYDLLTVCHSFVVDGRIQFLEDCTHALARQTVDIPPWSALAAQES